LIVTVFAIWSKVLSDLHVLHLILDCVGLFGPDRWLATQQGGGVSPSPPRPAGAQPPNILCREPGCNAFAPRACVYRRCGGHCPGLSGEESPCPYHGPHPSTGSGCGGRSGKGGGCEGRSGKGGGSGKGGRSGKGGGTSRQSRRGHGGCGGRGGSSRQAEQARDVSRGRRGR